MKKKADRRRFALIILSVLLGSICRQVLIGQGVTYWLALILGLVVTGLTAVVTYMIFAKFLD